MTEDQAERLVCAFEKMADCFESIAHSANDLASSTDTLATATSDVASAITGAYDGTGQSAFWGMSQALFMMVDSDNKGQGLHVIKQK